MSHSTALAPSEHPRAPRVRRRRKKHKQPKCPLTRRADGRWCKKIRGKMFYFTGDQKEAEAEWERRFNRDGEEQQLEAPAIVTVEYLVSSFLDFKQRRVDSGELMQRTWDRYHATAEVLIDTLGKATAVADLRPNDFERLRAKLAKRYSPVVLAVEIQTVRSILRYGYDEDLLDKPVKTGKGFVKPSAKVLRVRREEVGPKLYTAAEIWSLIGVARPNMRAMIWLAINCAFGPGDLSTLTLNQCDGTQEWLDHPRPKTGIKRRCWLWPETRAAIVKAIEHRQKPKDAEDAKLLFIGRRGQSYGSDDASYRVSAEFADVRKLTKVNDARAFYDFRRTFQTIGENSGDVVAVRHIMGHAPPASDMSSIYRQRIDDRRLVAVANVVRGWTLAGKPTGDDKTA